MSIKFNANHMRIIALFESVTGAVVKDCIIDDEKDMITFVVKNGEMGLAIGKGGKAIAKVQKSLGKQIRVVELDDDPKKFISNALFPAKLKSIDIKTKKNGEKIALITTDNNNKSLAIGRNGNNIKRAKTLLRRQHNIQNIHIK